MKVSFLTLMVLGLLSQPVFAHHAAVDMLGFSSMFFFAFKQLLYILFPTNRICHAHGFC